MCQGAVARGALVRGSRLMAKAVCATLGPFGAPVLIARTGGGLELVPNGGTVARRIVECGADPFENMGAMLVRHAVCRVDRSVGDATATTAVILDRLLRELVRLLDAGYDAVAMGRHLRACGATTLAQVDSHRLAISPEAGARAAAVDPLADNELGFAIAELATAVGIDGYVDVRTAHVDRLRHEFVEGARWRIKYDGQHPADALEFKSAKVAVTAESIDSLDGLGRLVASEERLGTQHIVVVCRSIAAEIRDRLRTSPRGPRLIVAALDGTKGAVDDALHDVAVYSGTAVAEPVAGSHLDDMVGLLGSVRRGWTSKSEIGLFSAGPTPALADLTSRLRREIDADTHDGDDILRERLARLEGRCGIINLPAISGADREVRAIVARRALRIWRHAAEGGVVPGGGSCLVRLAAEAPPPDVDPAVARALTIALEEPARRLLESAGIEPSVGLERMRHEPGSRVDLLTGDWQSAESHHVIDTSASVRGAIEAAISVASTVVLSEVLVKAPEPKVSLEP